jgi:hypothetical protein
MASLGAVTLPDDAVWTDEFGWSAVARSEEYSLTGALIVQVGARQAGRPITVDAGWLTRSVLLALETLAAAPDATYTLVLPQGTHTVRFRDPPFAVKPIRLLADPASTDRYEVTINLIKV